MLSDISHFGIPEGPNGPISPYFVAFSHALMKYAKSQKATKEFLKWVHSKEQFSKWFEIGSSHQVRHHRHLREGRPGDEPDGLREVGGGRAQEDLGDVRKKLRSADNDRRGGHCDAPPSPFVPMARRVSILARLRISRSAGVFPLATQRRVQ